MSALARTAAGVALTLLVLAPSASSAQPPVKTQACGKPQAASLLKAFVSAFNRGDARRLNTVFAKADRFRWYSVSGAPGERIDPDAHDRGSLLRYFAARHAAGEHFALTSATFLQKSRGFVDFRYSLVRTATDLSGPLRYAGKGAVVCFAGVPALAVWSMGPD